MKTHFLIFSAIFLSFAGCSRNDGELAVYKDAKLGTAFATKVPGNRVGNPSDLVTTPLGGVCLMGGGKDVDAAFKWMIARSGGGDFVILRFDNSTAYNSYVYKMGGVNSVETLIITSKITDTSSPVVDKINKAEAIFIAGGDQSNYVNLWKGTPVEDAINDRIKHMVPIGGTSAGCAILGSSYYAALSSSVTSAQAMANPFDPAVTLGFDDFIEIQILRNTITDQHFSQRGREGRMVAFMARMYTYFNPVEPILPTHGIAVDEQTAACIDNNGIATVFGTNNAFFLQRTLYGPEQCKAGFPLNWNRSGNALKVYRITGTTKGNGAFNLNDYSAVSGGTWLYFYVSDGTFKTSLTNP